MMLTPVVIPLTEWCECTDELSVGFYTCPRCGFARIPYGLGCGGDDFRESEFDARFCPGCAVPVIWETTVKP